MSITQSIEKLGANMELAAVFAEYIHTIASESAGKELTAMTAALADTLHQRSADIESIEKAMLQG